MDGGGGGGVGSEGRDEAFGRGADVGLFVLEIREIDVNRMRERRKREEGCNN